MNATEKIGWLSTALFGALWLLFGNTLITLLPGGANAGVARLVFAQATLWCAGLYLFVLLLRGAYLAGRNRDDH